MDRIFSILSGDEPETRIELDVKEKKRKKKVKSTKIEPIIKVKDDYTDAPHPNLLRLPFSLLLIAPKGSGKTTLLHNMLVWYFNMFDNIFIWSPTINIDVKWNKLIDKLEIPPENLFTKCKESQVEGLMRQIKDFNAGKENKKKIKCLFIFDDIVEQLPKSKKISFLNKLAMNHRHYSISHIIVSQSFKKLDPVVRSNTTGMVLFNTDNTAERMKIIEELAGNIGKMKFEKLWLDCVNIEYGFMYINYDSRLVYQNFDRVIADLNQVPEELMFKMNNKKMDMSNKVVVPGKKKEEPTEKK